jgi:hypothetical protein
MLLGFLIVFVFVLSCPGCQSSKPSSVQQTIVQPSGHGSDEDQMRRELYTGDIENQ